MNLKELGFHQRRALAHYRGVYRSYLVWRRTHLGRDPVVLATPRRVCSALGIATPTNWCWYAKAARWTDEELLKTRARLAAAAAWPPHRALWDCIHPHEASDWHNHDTGRNGHYGGLQMTPGWMGQIRGTADLLSPEQQEWAAERGYRASGYSRSWLEGQWGQTIGPCWGYA